MAGETEMKIEKGINQSKRKRAVYIYTQKKTERERWRENLDWMAGVQERKASIPFYS